MCAHLKGSKDRKINKKVHFIKKKLFTPKGCKNEGLEKSIETADQHLIKDNFSSKSLQDNLMASMLQLQPLFAIFLKIDEKTTPSTHLHNTLSQSPHDFPHTLFSSFNFDYRERSNKTR